MFKGPSFSSLGFVPGFFLAPAFFFPANALVLGLALGFALLLTKLLALAFAFCFGFNFGAASVGSVSAVASSVFSSVFKFPAASSVVFKASVVSCSSFVLASSVLVAGLFFAMAVVQLVC